MEEQNKAKEFFLKHKRFIVLMSIIITLSIITVVVANSPKVTIARLGDSLVWKYNKKLDDSVYTVVRNDEEVITLKETKFKDEKVVDKTAPDAVKKVNVEYNQDGVLLSWEEPKDDGNNNMYFIKVIDKNGKVAAKSKRINIVSQGGVKEYLVTVNHKEYRVKSTQIKILTTDLPEGLYTVDVSAIDNSNNKGKSCGDRVYVFRPYIKDNEVKILDSTSKYTYKLLFNNNTALSVSGNSIDVSQLQDKSAPEKITDIRVDVNNGVAYFGWNSVRDMSSVYDVVISGTNDKGVSVFGSGQVESKDSGVKGYYYAVNSIPYYKLSDADKFVEQTSFEKTTLIDGDNYIHVAAVDNFGNISDTTTKLVAFQVPKSSQE